MEEPVPNTFAARLHTVMTHFSLDSATLAEGISVAPALVDAWLCGEQRICASSPLLHKIAEYFSNHNLTLRDANWLFKQFQQSGLTISPVNSGDILTLLVIWLGTDRPERETPSADNAMLSTLSPSVPASPSTGFFDRVSYEEFSVKAGLPNIVLGLEKLFMSLPKGCDVNIHLSGNAMHCILEPAVSYRLSHYAQSLALNVRLLVSVSDSTGALPSLIALYLPLLSGGCMRLFMADSLSRPLTDRISLQAGAQHALLITETNDATSPPVSMLISEESALADLQKSFTRALRLAQPLLTGYSSMDAGTLHEVLTSEYCLPGDLDIVSDCSLPMFMPTDAYAALLGTFGLSGEALAEHSAAFSKRQASMEKSLDSGKTIRVVLRLSRVKQMLEDGECNVPGYLLAQPDTFLTMNAAACAASFEGLIDYLQRYPSSFLMNLTNRVEPFTGDSCWHIQQNHHVTIASLAHGASDVLYADDSALVHGFSGCFHALWCNSNQRLGGHERTILTLSEAIRLLRDRFLR